MLNGKLWVYADGNVDAYGPEYMLGPLPTETYGLRPTEMDVDRGWVLVVAETEERAWALGLDYTEARNCPRLKPGEVIVDKLLLAGAST